MATAAVSDMSAPKLGTREWRYSIEDKIWVQIDNVAHPLSNEAAVTEHNTLREYTIGQRERAERAERRFSEEEAIVTRIWEQLGKPSYAELAGRSIYDKIDELKACTGILRELIDALPYVLPGKEEGPLLVRARAALKARNTRT